MGERGGLLGVTKGAKKQGGHWKGSTISISLSELEGTIGKSENKKFAVPQRKREAAKKKKKGKEGKSISKKHRFHGRSARVLGSR